MMRKPRSASAMWDVLLSVPLYGFISFLFMTHSLPTADLGVSREDLMASIRKLEAQLAQEKFFHEKSKAEQQQEIKVKCSSIDRWIGLFTARYQIQYETRFTLGEIFPDS